MSFKPIARRVLVTGATGFTGGALALELVGRGHEVSALVRKGSETEYLEQAGIVLRQGDIRNADEVIQAAEGAEIIYHIAAVFRTAGHPDSFYRAVNADGVRNVIRAARIHGVKRTVHCSTVGVHGHVSRIPASEDAPHNPGDIYQVTKLEGERIAFEAFASDVPGVIVRPAAIYGPGDLRFLKLFRGIQRGRFVMFGSGETLYHPVYIDDLVRGIILCGEHPGALGQIYILGGDEYLSLNALVRLISEAVGVRPPRIRVPYWPLLAAATVCEGLFKPLGIDPPLHRRRAAFFIKDRAFSCERARRDLGYTPSVSVREGVFRTAKWYFDTGMLKGSPPPILRDLAALTGLSQLDPNNRE